MDYGFPSKRKSKNDKRAKARYNRFKRGGSQRTMKIKKEIEISQDNSTNLIKDKKSKRKRK